MNKIKDIIKKYWLLIVIGIQPIIDIISYFQVKTGGSSYTWIIRILLILITCMISFIKSKNKKKLILYLSPIIIFFLFHVLNLYRINSLSLIADLKYFIFVFQTPILAVLLIDYFKNSKDQIEYSKKGIIISGIILTLSIFIAFITNTYEPTYITATQKIGIIGWFSSANTNSMILCAVLPWVLYYFLTKKNPYIYGIISGLGFILLYTNGTRSCYLTLIASLLVIIYITITDKKIESKKTKFVMTVFLLVLSIVLFNTSFTSARKQIVNNTNNNYNEEVNNIDKPEDEPKDPAENLTPVIIDFSDKEKLIKILNTSYMYRDLIKLHGENKVIKALGKKFAVADLSDNRRVKIINAQINYDNSDMVTKFLGFGYSIVGNQGYDMENDLHAIFYYYGYIGFTIYISYLLYFLIKMFICFIRKPKVIFDGEFIILGFLLVLLTFGGEYSGAFLRKSNANIYLSFYLAYIYYRCRFLERKGE